MDQVAMLGGAIWALLFMLPKARRERDRFGIICSLLTALAGFIGWLFIGVGTRSSSRVHLASQGPGSPPDAFD